MGRREIRRTGAARLEEAAFRYRPTGVIVALALTETCVDDVTTGSTLIEEVDGVLGRVTANAAYDTIGFYEAAGPRGATVVVLPTSTATEADRLDTLPTLSYASTSSSRTIFFISFIS